MDIVQGNYVEQVPDRPAAPPSPQEVQAQRIEQLRAQFSSFKEQMDAWISETNLAEQIDEPTLAEIGALVCDEYDIDKDSRSEWEKQNKEALELARLISKEKQYAGAAVANIKYPLLATACIQFSARAMPSIVKGDQVVKGVVVGKDPQGLKAALAQRLSEDMSHQVLEEMEGWEDDTDQLLTTLPLVGCGVKKTYYSPSCQQNKSEYVCIDDFVVHYKSKSFESAPRQTHLIELSKNEVIERVRSGMFLDVELGEPHTEERDQEDTEAPHEFLEQHRTYDLDGDGYKEPYIITAHKESRQVVRIVARWDMDGVTYNEAGEIVRIDPVNYFSGFKFMPAFDGSCYGMGFGALLSGINSTVNTTINQLLDAGTLSNRQAGFLGKGIRLGRSGAIRFQPGEWKPVDCSGADLKNNVVPLPVREPSAVLFQLLGLMTEAGQKLSSVSDILTGENPAANTPATTVLALIEQGLKVFSAIYKRVHRGLKAEYKKLRRLCILYRTQEQYAKVVDAPQGVDVKADYRDENMDVVPVSDTSDVSDTQRLLRAQGLTELLGKGLNDKEIYRRYLEALQVDEPEKILEQEDDGPSIEEQMMQVQLQMAERELRIKELEASLKTDETREKLIKMRAESIKALAQAESEEVGTQIDLYNAYVGQIVQLLQGAQIDSRNHQGSVQGLEGQQPGNSGDVGRSQPAAGPSY